MLVERRVVEGKPSWAIIRIIIEGLLRSVLSVVIKRVVDIAFSVGGEVDFGCKSSSAVVVDCSVGLQVVRSSMYV